MCGRFSGVSKNGYVLFGNNVYLNLSYMAMPYPNVRGGSQDNYNFFIHRWVLITSDLFIEMLGSLVICYHAVPLSSRVCFWGAGSIMECSSHGNAQKFLTQEKTVIGDCI